MVEMLTRMVTGTETFREGGLASVKKDAQKRLDELAEEFAGSLWHIFPLVVSPLAAFHILQTESCH